jgi:peptide/nickel transport system permease protein
MHRYIVKRLLLAIPTLVGAAALVFVLMRLIPGDICVIRLGGGGAHIDPASVAACHRQLGLDDPLIVQFLDFLWSYCTFDFGISMWSGNPVIQEIGTRLPVSLQIAVMATVIAIVLAIPLGTISALKEGTWLDHVVRVVSVAGIATPSFWLGIMSLILVLNVTSLATGKPWLPPIDYVPPWKDFWRNLSIVLLPAITVGYRYSAVTMRITRSAMLEVLREDYIRTARAKGLGQLPILLKHALKNAAIPIVTTIGSGIALLIGGVVVTESVFAIPGIGRLTIEAVTQRDYPVIQGVILLSSLAYVVINLLIDLSYGLFDPRVRNAKP